jgi:hypothetical protein
MYTHNAKTGTARAKATTRSASAAFASRRIRGVFCSPFATEAAEASWPLVNRFLLSLYNVSCGAVAARVPLFVVLAIFFDDAVVTFKHDSHNQPFFLNTHTEKRGTGQEKNKAQGVSSSTIGIAQLATSKESRNTQLQLLLSSSWCCCGVTKTKCHARARYFSEVYACYAIAVRQWVGDRGRDCLEQKKEGSSRAGSTCTKMGWQRERGREGGRGRI